MKSNVLKYLLVYSSPFFGWVSLNSYDAWSYIALIFTFVFVPLMEFFIPKNSENHSKEVEETLKNQKIYDWILYGLVPIHFYLLFLFCIQIQKEDIDLFIKIGWITAYGISCGVLGINAAHELGHRSKTYEINMSKLLLMTSLYMHFYIEHNRGHHKNVSTEHDPASARYGETIYAFYFRSIIHSFISAWQIEKERLTIQKLSFLHYTNRMIIYTLLHIALLSSILFIFGFKVLIAFVIAAIIGILLLETVNYIEHYGLVRQQKENGTYERVRRWHSWNSNHVLGRIVLFELSRHSDHHYKADRPYQLLESHEESPTMPTGYPGMMLMAVVPPLFFKVMNNRVEATRNTNRG
jgi:alkane 1-monooxygenase